MPALLSSQHHCYPASFSGAIGGGATAAAALGSRNICDPSLRKANTDASGSQRATEYPNGLSNVTIDQCCAACNTAPDCVAYIFAEASNPDPTGQNCWPLSAFDSLHVNPGRVFAGVPPPPSQQAWWAMGQAADWYLGGAQTPLSFTKTLYELTGAPAILPRYSLGFMATYWGYQTMEQVEGNMTAFRDGSFPIDSFIMVS